MAEDPSPQDGLQSGFPHSPSAFDADDRVSFSRLDNKFILETDEGSEFEWDSALKRWIPALDQSEIDRQGEVYRVAGVDETEDGSQQPIQHEEQNQQRKKRKKDAEESAQKPKKQRVNTGVYVTSLPLDVDEEEIEHVFSKCGVIAEEIDSGRSRIKMYKDDEGNFKGDALVVYFRPESVDLAIQMLDDSDFRIGQEGPAGKMRVQAADFSYKKQTDQPLQSKANRKDQQKVIKKTQKMNNKLADWDDDDPQALAETSSRWDKVVVLKHMFTLEELEEDPAAMLEIKEDIREECAKLGPVTNVVLFDKEAQGVVTVRFANAEAARACVKLMDGRWFDKTQVQASIADGSERFKKSGNKQAELNDEDADSEEGGRLDNFGSWLEADREN